MDWRSKQCSKRAHFILKVWGCAFQHCLLIHVNIYYVSWIALLWIFQHKMNIADKQNISQNFKIFQKGVPKKLRYLRKNNTIHNLQVKAIFFFLWPNPGSYFVLLHLLLFLWPFSLVANLQFPYKWVSDGYNFPSVILNTPTYLSIQSILAIVE